MKLIFMGTPDFAVSSLAALVEAGHEVLLAVTQPDKPKGRGHKMAPPPVKEYAQSKGIEVYQPTSMRTQEVLDKLASYGAQVFIVAAYGKILPQTILDLPQYGCINVHASLLPKYRGAAPIQWSIANGETVTGVTTMQMDAGLDTGDMLLKTEVAILPEDTGETLHDKLAAAGARVLLETLDRLEAGTLSREKQDDSLSCYAPMLNKEVSRIDFSKTAAEIVNLVRAMNPYPTAHTLYQGRRMRVFCAEAETYAAKGRMCGEIIDVSDSGILVRCANGAVRITEVQFDGKKRMPVREYLKGNRMESGEILGAQQQTEG